MHAPREPHLAALKRLLRYLRGTLGYGLLLGRSSTAELVVYTDADWASKRVVSVINVAGFKPSDHDLALFIHLSARGRTLLFLYVDDMLIIGDDAEHISHVKRQLGSQFQMSDLGPLSYFLGIEVMHSVKGFYLSVQVHTRPHCSFRYYRYSDSSHTYGSSLAASSH
jgi:hypothetical protein